MRKLILGLAAVAGLLVPTQASAAIPSVFNDLDSPAVACEVQTAGNAGERFCTTPAGQPSSRVASFDKTPIDVAVALPPEPAQGTDGDFPLIGLYHGYGGSKGSFPLAGATVQHWVDKGYAVFTMSDRGFYESCGSQSSRENLPAYFSCDEGFISLLDQRYEVRDAQTMMGYLADDGVIDPQRIGAAGGSYGGAMAAQLGALRDRVRLPDGSYTDWVSPDGTPLEISATTPQITWSSLSQSLLPNGSRLDYVTEDPYYSLNPDAARTGVEKQLLLQGLYFFNGQAVPGRYQPTPGGRSDVTGWKAIFDTGGPYDTGSNATAIRTITQELETYHSVSGISLTDPNAEEPAPALLSNGLVDDLFPVDESVGYYNRVRAAYPDNPISMFHLNLTGHPRGVTRAGDGEELLARQDEWMDFYVKGEGTEPEPGVAVKPFTCPTGTPSGATIEADTWADLAPGEVTIEGPVGEQTIAGGSGSPDQPGDTPSGTECGTVPAVPLSGNRAVVVRSDPAPEGGYTIAGSPTVLADWSLLGSNDQVAVRLVDLADEEADEGTLVARGTWRPIVGDGAPTQVFQLHPNAWKVEEGHVLALQLMPGDSLYTRSNPTTGGTDVVQNPVGVSDIELRLPVNEEPGSAPGVAAPADKLVPDGYELSADYVPDGTPMLKAAATPKTKTIKRGKAATYTLKIRNTGDADATDLKACPKVPRPLKTRDCVFFADLGADGSIASQRFKVTSPRNARPKTYPISFRVTAAGAQPVTAKAKLKLKK